MSDIKLFRTTGGQIEELVGTSVSLEKNLQALLEQNLETFLGVRFFASEHSTGKTHGGRIDTLGLDENGSPVIIEYKRAVNENVINQGLFYLDWLLDHRAEFTLLAMKMLGPEVEDTIDWSSPRLLCIAGDFTRYDGHAVHQINRNIELLRYRRYGDDYLVLELVNAVTGSPEQRADASAGAGPAKTYKTVTEFLDQAPEDLQGLFDELTAFLIALGDDVQQKTLRYYFAFRRIKNFACVEVRPQSGTLLVFLKVDPATIDLEEGFTRDMTNTGHFGTGDLEVTIRERGDLERAKPLLIRSYEAS